MITNPKLRKPNSSPIDLGRTVDFVRDRCVGTDIQPNYAGTCLMTNVWDNNFVLDYLPPSVPGYKNVAIYTAGWGFKFTPMIGKVLKELVVDGKTDIKIDKFSINRPGILEGSPIPDPTQVAKVATYGSQRR